MKLRFGVWFFVGFSTAIATAEQPHAREFLEVEPLVTATIDRPARLLDQPSLAKCAGILMGSRELQRIWQQPESDQARQALAYAEQITERNGIDAVRELASGRLTVAAAPGHLVALYELPTAALAERFASGIRQFGPTFIGRTGHCLVLSNHRRCVEAACSKLVLQAESATSNESSPIAEIRLNLHTVRKLQSPDDPLRLPAKDAGLLVAFGTWVGLLTEVDSLTARLTATASTVELQLEGTGGSSPSADAGSLIHRDTPPAPLLQLPKTIYTASWSHDLAALWNDRQTLLTSEGLAKLEKGDADIETQFSAFRIKFRPSEVVETFGAQFRVAVARQEQTDYRVELDEVLPAGVFVVSLKDAERFEQLIKPFTRVVGLLVAFGPTKMASRRESYQNAQLTSLAFHDNETAAARGNSARYNFRPTWTVAQRHFVLGSTTEIVRQTVDQFAAESQPPANTGELSRQAWSFDTFAEAVIDIRSAVVRELVLQHGWTIDNARHEVTTWTEALAVLGRLESRLEQEDRTFRYVLTLTSP